MQCKCICMSSDYCSKSHDNSTFRFTYLVIFRKNHICFKKAKITTTTLVRFQLPNFSHWRRFFIIPYCLELKDGSLTWPTTSIPTVLLFLYWRIIYCWRWWASFMFMTYCHNCKTCAYFFHMQQIWEKDGSGVTKELSGETQGRRPMRCWAELPFGKDKKFGVLKFEPLI